MADITYFPALGDLGLAFLFYDAGTLDFVSHSSTRAVMKDGNGARVVFTGTDLTFDGAAPTGGVIETITLYSAPTVDAPQGEKLTVVTGAGLDAAMLYATFQSSGLLGVQFEVIAGNDQIFGSDKADYMLGNTGRDAIFGGRGDDFLWGNRGSDTMTGGAGADTFIFVAKEGSDTIVDFHDTGPKELRDHIRMKPGDFRHMVVTQDGDDTEIAYGRGGHITLLDYQADHLNRGDFILS